MFQSGLQNLLGGNILAEINHIKAVVLQQGTHDIFADIMDITFHGRHKNASP